ncbi:TRAUB-domain-containing protein [Lojkania enalia]|uniref:Protein BFR2 n=1 Tax=Lojkania enalia TaxID=147567 RepID=A0A9P4NAL9_9PLEO|nr:TRAUB-domain-containing protein [Didymosphaeria enalia]
MVKSRLRDFDPESLLDPAPSSSSDENSEYSSDDDAQAGREHYSDVGKSILRKKEVVPLRPQYSGAMISRDAAEAEDSDDPFATGRLDEDEESDEENEEDYVVDRNRVELDGDTGESEEELRSDGGDEAMDDFGGGEEDEDDEDDDEDEVEDEDDESDDSDEAGSYIQSAKLRAMMKDADEGDDDEDNKATTLRDMYKDTSLINSTISQAANADIRKGQAVKSQKKTFDSLLNTRIRLQKALISTNSLVSDKYSSSQTPESVISAAESAALTLLTNLTNLRDTLSSHTGQKRKRHSFTSSTASTEIWSTIQDQETSATSYCHNTLEKWNQKTRKTNISTKSLLTTSTEQTLPDILQSQLSDLSHLIARTQIPRSCAPVQSAAGMQSSKEIYDDADFYGLLLKELLESHSNRLSTNGAPEFIVQAPWQVAREAKTRKVVDTKASKGRKLRYTVHEKLQNFMAPEDRGTWGDRQRDELFSSLFGRRLGLGEEVENEEEEDRAEEGLMLFRS